MQGVAPQSRAVFFQLDFRRAAHHLKFGAIVQIARLGALEPDHFAVFFGHVTPLLALGEDFDDDARADGFSAFAYGEAEFFLHGDGGLEFNFHGDVIARHDHFSPAEELGRAGDVGGPEVELGSIPREEGGMTAALLLGQDVDFGFELRVRGDALRLSENLTAFEIFFFNAAEEDPDVFAGLSFVQGLVEGFDAGDNRIPVGLEPDDFDGVADLAPCRARYGRCRPCRVP